MARKTTHKKTAATEQLATVLVPTAAVEAALATQQAIADASDDPASVPSFSPALAVAFGEAFADDEPAFEAIQDLGAHRGDEYLNKGRSVVAKKYKVAYRPHDASCGDQMSRDLAIRTTIGTGKQARVDLIALRAIADLNGVWDERYGRLNPGMQRMNVGNKLRGLAKRNKPIVWSDEASEG